MMELRDYQEKAIEKLKIDTNDLLEDPEDKVLVFQAPTGSGKTIMAAEFLKRLVKGRRDGKKFSFVWISVRRLHDQSKEKLERYYEHDRLLKCSSFEDLQDKTIGENEILFINWDSINKKNVNVFIRENEQDNNLNKVVENTKDQGRQIILIIDESHHTAGSEKSRELILQTIVPKVTIEISATPHSKHLASRIVEVSPSEVKAEEMIKTEIAVNPEFLGLKVGDKTGDELVIEQALKKRQEMAKAYKKEGSNVNPLLLIQLPDQRKGMEDKKEEVVKILKKLGITEDNGKLAIWLSEDKSETLPNIEKNDNEVEVLIFKQAIALGWDCPRASILVVFRELKSFTFTIQTIGRIMRMPEWRHYTREPELNKGFVFTNLPNIEIKDEYAKDYVTIYESKRRNKLYQNISLKSIYLKRQRERTRISGEFAKIFADIATQRKLKDRVTLKPSRIVDPIIADGKIVNIDRFGEIEHRGTIEAKPTERELQARFDSFIVDNCTPYAPADSSDRMKTALYNFFQKHFDIEKFDPKVQEIVLGKENVQLFVDAINLAKEKYKTTVVEQTAEKRELQVVEKWEVPPLVSYNSKYAAAESPKSIMEPLYLAKPSQPEKLFMAALDKSDKVKWWFNNEESEIKYFAVLYKDEGDVERAFYIDFLVMFKDGKIGLFDTKSGMTAEGAGPRAEGLQKYIAEQNKKGKKLWGGIVIYVNGTWRYNDEKKYSYNPNNLSEWKVLEL